MKRTIATVTTAALTTAGLATALAFGPSAAAEDPIDDDLRTDPRTEMLDALSQDLAITPQEAELRLDREQAAARTDNELQELLGSTYAGSWLDEDATTLTVAVSDPSRNEEIRALDAVPKTVEHSQSELDAQKSRLDAQDAAAPETVAGWYIDVTANDVVVLTNEDGDSAAQEWVESTGVHGDEIRFRSSNEHPEPLVDIIGGNGYTSGEGTCSIGFAVEEGFVTAGHCGSAGTSTQDPDGTVEDATFPGSDYAWVRTDSGNTPQPLVNGESDTVSVAGAEESPVGASICRSGSTTGWHCGTVEEKDASVNYPEGTVHGLTRTDVCAEPGDSGGSWLSDDQAQGVTSGGSGDCQAGGTTYFQPIDEILATYDLDLVTEDDGEDPPGSPADEWEPYTYYTTGTEVTYDDVGYEALQSHLASPDQTPPTSPFLWQEL